MARLTSTDLANDYLRKGLGGRWLSQKQAAYLRDLMHAELPADHTCSRREANGNLTNPDGSFAGSWSIDLMPNGCAIFRTHTDLVGDALKHREAVATHVGNLIWDSMTENQPTDPAAWKAHTLAAIEARTFAIGYTKALLEHEDTTDHTYDQLRDRAVAAHRATRVSELMLTTP